MSKEIQNDTSKQCLVNFHLLAFFMAIKAGQKLFIESTKSEFIEILSFAKAKKIQFGFSFTGKAK